MQRKAQDPTENILLFCLAAPCFALAQMFWWMVFSSDSMRFWERSTMPVFSICYFTLHGVVFPVLLLVALWLQERRILRFLLLTTAAATILVGCLAALGPTLALCHGEVIGLREIATGYGLLTLSLVCLILRWALPAYRPQPIVTG